MKNLDAYIQKEKQLEAEGRFDEDIIPYRTDNAAILDGNYRYDFTPTEKIIRGILFPLLYLVVRPLLFFACGYHLRGKKNCKGLHGGIIISNHVHHLDCLMVEPVGAYHKVFHTGAGFNCKKDIRGRLLKLLGFLPLNGSYGAQKNLMARIKEILSEGGYVHFYPEHALWPRYEKMRPFKTGAFKYAAKFACPVIPVFITFEETALRKFFHLKKRCVANILPPVYPNADLTAAQNAENMKQECIKRIQEFLDSAP